MCGSGYDKVLLLYDEVVMVLVIASGVAGAAGYIWLLKKAMTYIARRVSSKFSLFRAWAEKLYVAEFSQVVHEVLAGMQTWT